MQPGIDGADAAKDDVSGTFVVEDPSDSGLGADRAHSDYLGDIPILDSAERFTPCADST